MPVAIVILKLNLIEIGIWIVVSLVEYAFEENYSDKEGHI